MYFAYTTGKMKFQLMKMKKTMGGVWINCKVEIRIKFNSFEWRC